MAWYLNKYKCEDCGAVWEDQWSCSCDDECPECSVDHSPYNSVDMSAYVEKTKDGTFTVYYSPPEAQHFPDYTFFAEVIMENVALALAEIAKDIACPE
jgi:predicted  nucleic acid-binding Zn-ribbon protein